MFDDFDIYGCSITLLIFVLMDASAEAIQRGRPVPDFLRDLAGALQRYAGELEKKGVCSI